MLFQPRKTRKLFKKERVLWRNSFLYKFEISNLWMTAYIFLYKFFKINSDLMIFSWFSLIFSCFILDFHVFVSDLNFFMFQLSFYVWSQYSGTNCDKKCIHQKFYLLDRLHVHTDRNILEDAYYRISSYRVFERKTWCFEHLLGH